MKTDEMLDLGVCKNLNHLLREIEYLPFTKIICNNKVLYDADMWDEDCSWSDTFLDWFKYHFGDTKNYYLKNIKITFENYRHTIITLKVVKKKNEE